MARFGVGDDDLREKRFSECYAALLKFQVERTWELFNRGKPLPGLVSGRLAFELRLTWLGGPAFWSASKSGVRHLERAAEDLDRRQDRPAGKGAEMAED